MADRVQGAQIDSKRDGNVHECSKKMAGTKFLLKCLHLSFDFYKIYPFINDPC